VEARVVPVIRSTPGGCHEFLIIDALRAKAAEILLTEQDLKLPKVSLVFRIPYYFDESD
jgi:hypothetical protein